MHYYQFNIGNYYRDTSGLSPLEDLAYRRAIDKYHLTEQPLNGCSTDVAKRLGLCQHESEVGYILNEYFDFKDGAWHHSDIDETIRAYHTDKKAKKNAGIKSGQARRRKASEQALKSVQSNDEQNAGSVELTNNHEPLTNNQEPSKEDIASKPAIPVCPIQKVAELYNSIVVHMSKWRVLGDDTRRHISTIWKKHPEFQNLQKWENLFKYCEGNRFLSGQSDGERTFRADLNWIVKPANFTKIWNGKYDNS